MVSPQLGRYEVLGSVGQGAMGVVYKAHDPLIERTVAIKTVSCAGLSADEVDAFEHRFFREAKSAGRLSHPNIVTIHDVGRSGDVAYIAMEFLEGQSLREILDSGVVLPPDQAADIAAQVADGLAFAHAHGIVHRDVKPANIMVLTNGTAKIADFGVALLPTTSTTMAGMALGSPKYMSPEQVAGEALDGRSDIFSLGAVLYEMLAGVPPFEADDLNGVLTKVLSSNPPPPSSRRRSLPAELDRIVAKAMAKVPGDRYQGAEDMAADLHRCAGEVAQATVAPDVAAATVSPRWRRPLAMAATTAVLAAFAAWLLLHGEQTPPVVATKADRPLPPGPPAKQEAPPALPNPAPERSVTSAAAVKPVPPTATSRLQVAVSPWGEVFVDGRKHGISPPLSEIVLPAGKHLVEIRNAAFPTRREMVHLAPAGSTKIKHRFASLATSKP